MFRLICLSVYFVAIHCAIRGPAAGGGSSASESCEESKYTMLKRTYICELASASSRSTQSCKGFGYIKSSKMIQDPAVTDIDNVRYAIKDNRAYAINTDGQTYTIILGNQNKYAPIMMKMNQEKNTLFILASTSNQCPKKGGLFVLKTDLIVPDMHRQIVIGKMENLGESFTSLDVTQDDEVELSLDEENKLILNPNAEDPCLD